jgi:hypothetical protein
VATANEQLLDAQIGHQVDLQRYANGVVRRLIGVLNRADADLAAQLTAVLESLPPESFTVDRLEALLLSVRRVNLAAYQQIERELTAELRALADYEAGFQRDLFESVIPPQIQARIAIVPVSVEQVYTAAFAQPFRGRLLREWAAGIEADRMVRIRDAVRLAYVENQPTAKLVQRIRGTRAKGYSDGIIEIDRRHAEAVARTAISHVAAVTNDRFMAANADLVKALSWLSTLDSRTSEMCRIRDGLQYTAKAHRPIGHSVPWLGGPGRLHWCCRSTSTPVVKSWRELGIDMDEMSPGTRASMDGQVPADMSYGAWLKKQSAARQDDILGPSRGALLRKGGLEMERFYNDKGRYLSLDELRERDAAAFKRAGL